MKNEVAFGLRVHPAGVRFMLVIDKPILTDLARAFRRHLDAVGIKVGHQTSLNLCIAALGLDPSNRALAILEQRPLLVAPPAYDHVIAYPPTVILTQLARLAEATARTRPDLGAENSSAAEMHGQVDACCVALRASIGGGGGYAALRNAPEAGRGRFAYVLKATDIPHPAPDSSRGSPLEAGSGAVVAITKWLETQSHEKVSERCKVDVYDGFRAALDETVCRPDPSSNMRRGIGVTIEVNQAVADASPNRQVNSPYTEYRHLVADWRGDVWTPRLLRSLDGYSPLAGLARTTLIATADRRPIGILMPDGVVHDFNPAHLADDSGLARLTANPPSRPF
jgi:hypothetical protein